MYVCLTCELVIPTVLRAYVGVRIYETAYVRRYEVCMYCVCNIAYICTVCMFGLLLSLSCLLLFAQLAQEKDHHISLLSREKEEEREALNNRIDGGCYTSCVFVVCGGSMCLTHANLVTF